MGAHASFSSIGAMSDVWLLLVAVASPVGALTPSTFQERLLLQLLQLAQELVPVSSTGHSSPAREGEEAEEADEAEEGGRQMLLPPLDSCLVPRGSQLTRCSTSGWCRGE